MSPVLRVLLLSVLCLVASRRAGGAAEAATSVPPRNGPAVRGAEVVELPGMFVVEGRNAPDWLYVSFPGGEMLAACTAGEAKWFARRFQRNSAMVRALVPDEFRGDFAQPELLVVFDRRSLNVMPSDLVQAARRVAPPMAEPTQSAPRIGEALPTQIRVQPMPNLAISGEDVRATTIELGGDESVLNDGGSGLRLSEQFVSKWLLRRRPLLPEWYVEGICGLIGNVVAEPDRLTFRPLAWPMPPSTTNRTGPRLTLRPVEFLKRFATPLDFQQRSLRRAHRELFVRWALDGNSDARRAGFHELVRRNCRESLHAGMLRECLGLDEDALTVALKEKLARVARRSVVLALDLDAPWKQFDVRRASRAEITRMLSEWHRLAYEHCEADEAVRARYLDAATQPIRRLHEQGSRAPGVEVALALAEMASGRAGHALPWLENAARAESVRPAVWRSLAEARLEAFTPTRAGLDATQRRLQFEAVLEAAKNARATRSPSLQAYEVWARVWQLAERVPTDEDLAVLGEAARDFPDVTPLVETCATICARHGRLDWARRQIALGLHFAASDEARATLTAVLQRLEAGPDDR